MDVGYISALSALAGSAIGALASLATTWLTQNSQMRITLRTQDRARREALYSEFIREASKLFADAITHELGPSSSTQLAAESAFLASRRHLKRRRASYPRSAWLILRRTKIYGCLPISPKEMSWTCSTHSATPAAQNSAASEACRV